MDDGSPDSCGAICDEYAQKDSRIRVVHQDNAGVSAARNRGIKESQGEYIAFIDADDWVRPDYLQILYCNLKEHRAEMSIVKAQYVGDSLCEEPVLREDTQTFRYGAGLEYLCTEKGHALKTVWGKLISARIVRDILLPQDRCYAEDMAVTYRWIERAECIVISNQEKYCYYQNEDSLSHGVYTKARRGNLKTLREMRDFFQEKGYVKLYKQYTFSYALDLCSQYKNLIEVLNDRATANLLKEELKHVIATEGKNCGITVKTAPQCFEIIHPRSMYVYWVFINVKNKLSQRISEVLCE